ncbi:hypothetical protein ACTI_72260 [Actinoplanes sp. OR16]|uniref:hypothetical protein n=1 Tax=Actinoplanes sp. OR16 TaxID=946334 RepID=UPI000F6B3426|nr:hypothetical protein [Actinoplanes sp. OR16]BBH70541.1 hypothetical protein ACTI_72260 [Actinoplanes sp. OR16]
MMVLFVAVVGLILAAVLALWPLSKGTPTDGTPAGGTPFDDTPTGGTRAENWRAENWRAEDDEPRPRRFRGSARVRPGGQGHAEPTATPTTLEGILAGQLLSGEISQRQYLRALESLAARDEERHPMIMRWDDRPGAWS